MKNFESSERERKRFINWSEFLNDPEVIGAIKKINKGMRKDVVGYVLLYLTLRAGTEEKELFFKDFSTFQVNTKTDDLGTSSTQFFWIQNVLIPAIARQLEISDVTSCESQDAIYAYWSQCFNHYGYYFHGFNGMFEDSIRREGLHPKKRAWQTDDTQTINAIFQKSDLQLILGCLKAQKNEAVYMSGHVDNIYYYAVSSPEWFGMFTSTGYHLADDADKQAFYRKDKAACRRNLEQFCNGAMQQGKINLPEKVQVLEFFERQWMVMVGDHNKPKVALIPKKLILPPKEYQLRSEMKLHKRIFMDWAMAAINHPHEGIIPPESLEIVSLPEYSKLFTI